MKALKDSKIYGAAVIEPSFSGFARIDIDLRGYHKTLKTLQRTFRSQGERE